MDDKTYSITAKLSILDQEIHETIKELDRSKRELKNQQEIVNILTAELRVLRDEHSSLKEVEESNR